MKLKCPECKSTSIETMWFKPKPPREPYCKWWCHPCGASGVLKFDSPKQTNIDDMTEDEVESLKKALEDAKTTPSVKWEPES